MKSHGHSVINSGRSVQYCVTLIGALLLFDGCAKKDSSSLDRVSPRRGLPAERKGNDLAVVLGPVELTDVYKEAHVTVDQPLDLNSMIAYPAPYPGAEGAVVTSRLEAPGNSLIASTKNGVPSFGEQPV